MDKFERIRNFKKNNPQFKNKNVYLCESVDRDGNVVDVKYGVNIITNYGMKIFQTSGVHGTGSIFRSVRCFLGKGASTPGYGNDDEHELNKRITELAYKAADKTWPVATFQVSSIQTTPPFDAFTYDSSSKVLSTTQPAWRFFWDYTEGGDSTYSIYEIGLSNSSNEKTICLHALIYDETGHTTSITKDINTRLYITVYITYGVSFAKVPNLYNSGVYVYANPLVGGSALSASDTRSLYIMNVTRSVCEKQNTSESDPSLTNWYLGYPDPLNYHSSSGSSDKQRVDSQYRLEVSRDPRNCFFWEQPSAYCGGFAITSGDTWASSAVDTLCNMCNNVSNSGMCMLSYERYDTPETLETFYATIKASNRFLSIANTSEAYDSSLVNDDRSIDLSDNFGLCDRYAPSDYIPQSSLGYFNTQKWVGGAHLPCSNFDITELNMYNHLTKDYDISVSFTSSGSFEYNDIIPCTKYCTMYVTLDGVNKWVYVFIFPRNFGNITAFNNTGIELHATDEYWDSSTYEKILDLSNVPVSLQTKRYYIITTGNPVQLKPVFSNWANRHKIVLNGRVPFEFPQALEPVEYRNGDDSTNANCGCQPIVSQSHGFFVSPDKIIYLDTDASGVNDVANAVSYPIAIGAGNDGTGTAYPGKLSRARRYLTTNADKLVIFNGYYGYWDGQLRYDTYTNAKKHFVIYTITDKNTTPTAVEYDLSFQSTIGNNTIYPTYSWSSNGFLVAQLREGSANEASIVDVYGNQSSNNEPILYSIQNAKYCFALNLSNNCVYYSETESSGTTYIFKIYNMKDRQVVDTITIDDSVSYVVEGIYGWREFVYIQVKQGNNHYTYFYNTDNKRMQKLATGMYSDKAIRTDMYSWAGMTSINDCFVWCSGNRNANDKTIVITANNPTEISYLYDVDKVDQTCSNYSYYPCISTCNNGKQLLLTFITNCGYTAVADLGWFLDNGPIQHSTCCYHNSTSYAYDRLYVNATGSSYADYAGSVFPFNNGIITISGKAGSDSKSNRMWWQPIETKLPLHMVGTTYSVTAYNNPVNIQGKSGLISWTNNIADYPGE